MTKTRTTVLAGAVWIGALASTAAFAYTMNHPPAPPPAQAAAPPRMVEAEPPARPALAPPERFIVLPTVEIVSQLPRHVPVAAPAPRAAEPRIRDISEMKCSKLMRLEQGSGGVQVCD